MTESAAAILPGATIGMVGGGQLGRMPVDQFSRFRSGTQYIEARRFAFRLAERRQRDRRSADKIVNARACHDRSPFLRNAY